MKLRWIASMAWRDSRHSRRRLLLYTSTIVIGVAALVAIRSFGHDLLQVVEEEARTLLGADLAIRSRTALSTEAETLIRELGGEQARQTSFASMAYFPEQNSTRLVRVRALEGNYPFYGQLVTVPLTAEQEFRRGPFALVDETLMLQFGVEVGDPVTLGNFEFEILGRLTGIPGESEISSDFAPRIYIPAGLLERTGLIQTGSRVRYRVFFQFDSSVDVEQLVKTQEERFEELDLSVDTIAERKEDFQRELSNFNRFLSLVGFVALVLGGIGVASSINLYIRQRIGTVSVLRCLGARSVTSFGIYVLQALVLGCLGAMAGTLLGLAVQRILPLILSDLIPFEIEQTLSAAAILEGMGVGLATALLFSIIPLAPLRHVSPLLALRSDLEPVVSALRDRVVIAALILLTAGLVGFSLWNAPTWQIGLGFFGASLAVFLLLFLVARGLMLAARRWFPRSWNYEWRQGLANLYRPHNQTTILIVAVGLGTFFVATLYLVQASLLREVERVGSEDRPNLIFFDIQTDQKEAVEELIRQEGLTVRDSVPIVTMRLQSINGQSVEALKEDSERDRSRWALVREYRCTYRDRLSDSEKLVAGHFPGQGEDVPEVSVEEGIARRLQVGIGDTLVFNVQGIPIETRVGSLREVEWRSFQPNFFVVFPPGILEEAPQFHVLVTRTSTPGESARLQREIVTGFPNISAIDLSLVLATVDSILSRLRFVIQFMALFSIVTGVLVMIATIVSGRFQRIRECVLLRTLGASRGQIFRILLIEYFFLGLFSALTGLLLAAIAAWGLSHFVFEAGFVFLPGVISTALILVVGLTIVIGLSHSRGLLTHPPLEVLRSEE